MIDAESKMFVVIMILVVILLGLALFLFYLERRLARSEQQLKQLEQEAGNRATGPGRVDVGKGL